LVQVHRILV